MAAGIPGTGIGGIFYLILAFIMPVYEFCLLIRGRSSLARWRLVGAQVANALGVLASLAAMSWLARRLALSLIQLTTAAPQHDAQLRQMQSATTVSFAWLTIAVLGAVTMGVLVLRVIVAMVVFLRGKSLASRLPRDPILAVKAGSDAIPVEVPLARDEFAADC